VEIFEVQQFCDEKGHFVVWKKGQDIDHPHPSPFTGHIEVPEARVSIEFVIPAKNIVEAFEMCDEAAAKAVAEFKEKVHQAELESIKRRRKGLILPPGSSGRFA
jgi:hypothetical protein